MGLCEKMWLKIQLVQYVHRPRPGASSGAFAPAWHRHSTPVYLKEQVGREAARRLHTFWQLLTLLCSRQTKKRVLRPSWMICSFCGVNLAFRCRGRGKIRLCHRSFTAARSGNVPMMPNARGERSPQRGTAERTPRSRTAARF